MNSSARIPWRKYRNNDERIDMFYSEAWTLVHYLTFAPGWNKERSSAILQRALKARKKKAFQDVFWHFKDIEQGLLSYARKIYLHSYVLQNPRRSMKGFFIATDERGRNRTELGTYVCFPMILKRRAPDRTSPSRRFRVSSGHETLGFLNFADGKDEAAKAEFEKAHAADPQRYLSLYYAHAVSASKIQ